MATVLEYDSTPGSSPTWVAIDVPRDVRVMRLVAHAKGGIPTFTFAVHGGELPGLPDPWLGKVVRLTINSTLVFFGDVTRLDPDFRTRIGWLRPYSAFGLRNRGDWICHTDSNDGGDSSSYNLSADNQSLDYIPSRAGRTVGEVLVDVLSMPGNAVALTSVGLGNLSSAGYGGTGTAVLSGGGLGSITLGDAGTGYTSAPLVVLIGGGGTGATATASVSAGAITGFSVGAAGTGYTSAPTVLVTTLPATTVADLAALVFQPPGPCYFGGEKLLGAVEGFLATWAPNYIQHVEPGGDLRYLDTRAYTNHTFELGTDPVQPSGISRDLSECFQRVIVRGAGIAEMFRFSTKLGTLSEDPFIHDGLTVAQAKAAWVPDDYFRPEKQKGRVEGTCTCPGTTTVTITSAISTTTLTANELDQTATGRHAYITLTYSAATDILLGAQRGIVANTAMTAGSTSDVTVDRALPHLLYDHYTLTGLTQGPSAVWIDYALPAWAAPKVARQSQYPMNLSYAGGNAVTQTSTPTGIVRWSSSGNPPYQEGISGISVDTGSGIVRFNYPTRQTAGKEPDDVEVWIPIYTDVNTAIWPADVSGSPVYDGTSNTVDGLEKTLTVSVRQWRDPAQNASMLIFAADLLDSVKDAICEGVITYIGLYEPALAPGTAYSITGETYTTGWEGLSLANVETELAWSVDGQKWVTSIRVSNRRAHFSAEAFLHPDRTGVTFDFGGGYLDATGFAGPTSLTNLTEFTVGNIAAASQQNADAFAQNVDISGLNVAPPENPTIRAIGPYGEDL